MLAEGSGANAVRTMSLAVRFDGSCGVGDAVVALSPASTAITRIAGELRVGDRPKKKKKEEPVLRCRVLDLSDQPLNNQPNPFDAVQKQSPA